MMTQTKPEIHFWGWERTRVGRRLTRWSHVVSGVSYNDALMLLLERPARNRDILVMRIGEDPNTKRKA